jgi:hypothetical protein
MSFSGRKGVAFLLLAMLSRHATIVAHEAGPAPTSVANPPQGTASAPLPPAAADAGSTSDADWVAFATTLPAFGPDSLVGEATLFDLESGKPLRSFRLYGDHLRHVQFSPDGRLALLSFYNTCVLWNPETGAVVREFDQGGISHFSPDGSSILIYGEHQAARREVASGKVTETIQLPGGRGFKGRYTGINAHIDNEERRDASGTLIYNADASNYQAILDAATGKEVGLCPSNTRGCLVSGATKTVLQGGPLHPLNVVRVFDFSRNEIARFEMPAGGIEGLGGELRAVSRDGKQFLYARAAKPGGADLGPRARCRTRHYSVHDAGTGKEIRALGDFEANSSAHFSPAARRVVLLPTFGSPADDARDPEILVIDATTGAVDHRIYAGPWALPSLDFDADGNRMLVAGAMNLNFWRLSPGWRQAEEQSPLPRKVVDTLKILKAGQAIAP